MAAAARKGSSGSFHRVSSFELPKIQLEDEFSDIKFLAEGWYSKVLLARHTTSDSTVVLKCVHKETTKRKDFFREYHYNYYLSPHPNVLNSFEVAFDTPNYYVFTQEYASQGDLAHLLPKGGLGETKTKRVAEQLAFALEFVHTKDLVHRDVRLENVLVFDNELSRVKLGDFGLTQRVGALVKKVNVRVPWAPPEVCQAVYNEGYHCETSMDAWQLGILIFVCLTGSYPWYSADITDRHYNAWVSWHKRKTTKLPNRFKCFTPRLLRLMRRLLDPKPEKRAGVREVYKYVMDPWLVKGIDPMDLFFDESSSEIFMAATSKPHECAEKTRLREILSSYGIQTTVDKTETTRRICEWLLNSVTSPHRGM
ncbi:serine/threonine-protein kinase meng-po [Oratosquilla oratoria]|uniref:serine/threonine-protein kinase meng-po n=1 Tax=Oratosquilla oratoria TaxID=337810 RepID=UPI003F75CB4D